VNCPRCQEPLTVADRQGIEIDFCPRCRGVWMDRGELDKVVERSAAHAGQGFGRWGGDDDDDDDDVGRRRGHYPPPGGSLGPPPAYGQPGYGQPGPWQNGQGQPYPPQQRPYGQRKKKSFWSELFDD
jgi:Zn-finger nucleic acid-binding protein